MEWIGYGFDLDLICIEIGVFKKFKECTCLLCNENHFSIMSLSWSKKRRRNYVGQPRVCSKSVLGGKIRPVTPVLIISTIR